MDCIPTAPGDASGSIDEPKLANGIRHNDLKAEGKQYLYTNLAVMQRKQ